MEAGSGNDGTHTRCQWAGFATVVPIQIPCCVSVKTGRESHGTRRSSRVELQVSACAPGWGTDPCLVYENAEKVLPFLWEKCFQYFTRSFKGQHTSPPANNCAGSGL